MISYYPKGSITMPTLHQDYSSDVADDNIAINMLI